MTTITAKQMLDNIRKSLFKELDLARLPQQDSQEWRELILSEVERLFSLSYDGVAAAWLSDQIWTADKILILMTQPHPLMADELHLRSREELTELSQEEYLFAQWVREAALLCHDLFNHAQFDLSAIGDGLASDHTIGDDFSYANMALITWIRTTPYRRVAALVCYQVMDEETDRAMAFDPAVQDFYASEVWHSEPDWQDAEGCEDYTQNCLKSLQQMDDHHRCGLEQGLSEEVIRVTDFVVGFVPHSYGAEDVSLARDIVEAAEQLLPSKPYMKSEKGMRLFAEAMLPRLEALFKKYDIPFEPEHRIDITYGYLNFWLHARYYEE